MSTAAGARAIATEASGGYAFGALGVVIFALTLPMTRLAVGDVSSPQLPPAFVTAGRAALAGLLAAVYLLVARARVPGRRHAGALSLSAIGTVVGFPMCIALALREVQAMHAAVVSGLLPLATAVLGALVLRQRPSWGFWTCALLGTALVIGFAWWSGGGRVHAADGWLLLAMLVGAVGYVAGARVSSELPPEQVICWVLVGSLPLTLPASWWWWPQHGATWAAWSALGYVSVFSMWLGFFAWYRGLVLGGVVRISQVQMLQPFIALVFSAPLLGERLEPGTLFFALAVTAVVFVGRRMPVGQPAR